MPFIEVGCWFTTNFHTRVDYHLDMFKMSSDIIEISKLELSVATSLLKVKREFLKFINRKSDWIEYIKGKHLVAFQLTANVSGSFVKSVCFKNIFRRSKQSEEYFIHMHF